MMNKIYCKIMQHMPLPYLKEHVQPKQCKTSNYWKHCCIFARHRLCLFSRLLCAKHQHNQSKNSTKLK